jgi:hypothetical protein
MERAAILGDRVLENRISTGDETLLTPGRFPIPARDADRPG